MLVVINVPGKGLPHGVPARSAFTSRRAAARLPTVSIASYETMGWLRSAVGIALIAAPGAPMRLAGQEQPTGASMLLMRTIGIRDLVLGAGTVAAARSGGMGDVRRWTTSALASDSLDVAASLVSMRCIGRRDSISAALLALIFVGGDLYAWRRCRPEPQ